MKATEIIRRVDDLGRIVIPRELRDANGIETGTTMEISTDGGGKIILRKCESSPMKGL